MAVLRRGQGRVRGGTDASGEGLAPAAGKRLVRVVMTVGRVLLAIFVGVLVIVTRLVLYARHKAERQ